MTKEQLIKDIKAECENYIDTMIFYMDESNEKPTEVAYLFSKEFHDLIWKVAEELEKREENEEQEEGAHETRMYYGITIKLTLDYQCTI